jgi:OmpR family response regulator RpaB
VEPYINRHLKILIIDNDSNICQLLKKKLSYRGYKVLTTIDSKAALSIFEQEQPDLVILDVMLKHSNGYEICRRLKQISKVPIILLTALHDLTARIIGLEFGADDYLIKPFSLNELETRIYSVSRRVYQIQQYNLSKSYNFIQIGDLKVDITKNQIFKHNKPIKLTEIEFKLLLLLLQKAGENLTREIILYNLWGYIPERFNDKRVVDVYIYRLRTKLEKDLSHPKLIITTRNKGYMFRNI